MEVKEVEFEGEKKQTMKEMGRRYLSWMGIREERRGGGEVRASAVAAALLEIGLVSKFKRSKLLRLPHQRQRCWE